MFHLFQYKKGKLKGKYDFAFISKGRYICGSSQGYSRKVSAFNAMFSICKRGLNVQDDTGKTSKIVWAFKPYSSENVIISDTFNLKLKPPYQP